MVLVGRQTLEGDTMAEMAAWMKRASPDVKFAHAGSGSLAHLCAALLAQSLGVKVTMIPYRGGTPAMTDILAGHSDIYCSSPSTAMEQIKGKLIKAFAVTSPERMATLPEVPSVVALGYKDLDIQFWQGLYVAAGTPKPVVDRLNEALQLALADPKVLKSFADGGMSTFPKRRTLARGRHRQATQRDQTLGRGHPRQQHRRGTVNARTGLVPGRPTGHSGLNKTIAERSKMPAA
jgi:tripartite-type tricarboxylate transporter receptor subunit TctC